MRHGNYTFKLNRNSSHRRCMVANMLKSLIEHGRITTTLPKAKELRRHADRMITLAKKDTLHSKRRAMGKMMISFNTLSSKEARQAKAGNTSAYNTDREVMGKLGTLAQRFKERNGGYTRIIKTNFRRGDSAAKCFIEFVE